jgi:hypothetical protein
MLQPGQISNQQVEAAFQAFASILAAADERRKQRNTVRGGCGGGCGPLVAVDALGVCV